MTWPSSQTYSYLVDLSNSSHEVVQSGPLKDENVVEHIVDVNRYDIVRAVHRLIRGRNVWIRIVKEVKCMRENEWEKEKEKERK